MATTIEPRRELPTHQHPEEPGTGLMSWLTTVDHKRIGIMYLVVTLFFFLIGGLMALIMRIQLETADGSAVSPERYNQIFTMHGTTMVFLFVVPIMAAFGNYIVPLQIGARDMAFPRLNAASLWLLLFGGMLLYSSFLFGDAPDAGWTGYPPLSAQSPGHGIDFWILGLHVLTLSSVAGAINFICTIHNMRAPGMRLSRMPLFTWTIDFYAIMILFALPVLSGALTMLLLDRNFGTNFYDPSNNGNIILYQHLFWFFGHPEVYVVALPGFGMISEIVPVFSRKPLFGYKALVISAGAITFYAFLVWGHHMFATQFSTPVAIWFMLASWAIGVPTGVKVFNWIGTMWMGRIRYEPPMLYAVGFIGTFIVGGLSGIFLAAVPVDLYVTDSYFVVAHFHYVMGSVPVFAVIGGLHYWYPKITGRMLDRSLAIWSFWIIFVGFNLTFFPMHAMGLSGMPRRISHYPNHTEWEPMNQIATLGSFVLTIGILLVLWNCLRSLRFGRVAGNNPWGANSLEWYTTSPPPPHNFDDLPPIRSERPLWDLREERRRPVEEPA
ncbi:MAG: cytochrome c oxidase subunit I [Gaiellales bacterium]